MDKRSKMLGVKLTVKEFDLLNQYCSLMQIEKSEFIRTLIHKELMRDDR